MKLKFSTIVAILSVLVWWVAAAPDESNSSTETPGVAPHDHSPYLGIIFCTANDKPWECVREESSRLLDVWMGNLYEQWNELKVEADQEVNSTLQQRGFSLSQVKEKPSTILKKIEIGTNFIEEFVVDSVGEYFGRDETPISERMGIAGVGKNAEEDDDDEDEEEDEEEDSEVDSEEGEGKKQKKRKNKRKGQHGGGGGGDVTHESVFVVPQPAPHPVHFIQQTVPAEWHQSEHEEEWQPAEGSARPLKGKRKKRKDKRKQKPGHSVAGGGGAGDEELELPSPEALLEALPDYTEALDSSAKGHKKKRGLKGPQNYGRSLGAPRGKKKKKRKAIAKVVFWGSLIKGKIELLLKVLSAHLQVKFFVIALVGLLINLARFWLDVKRGGVPQKVIYYEHAQHQHHYEDHGDDWNDQGSYWKRSLEPTEEIATEAKKYDNVANLYNNDRIFSYAQPPHDGSFLAYRSQNRAF